MFTNILCATDASAHGDRALDYAAAVASGEHARLHVVHVVERVAATRMGAQNSRLDEDEREQRLRHRVSELSAGGLQISVHTPTAPAPAVADCIAQMAREDNVDLIVIGTRGQSPMVGAVLGSVAQRMLHVAPCPVLAIPDRCAETAGEKPVAVATAG